MHEPDRRGPVRRAPVRERLQFAAGRPDEVRRRDGGRDRDAVAVISLMSA